MFLQSSKIFNDSVISIRYVADIPAALVKALNDLRFTSYDPNFYTPLILYYNAEATGTLQRSKMISPSRPVRERSHPGIPVIWCGERSRDKLEIIGLVRSLPKSIQERRKDTGLSLCPGAGKDDLRRFRNFVPGAG